MNKGDCREDVQSGLREAREGHWAFYRTFPDWQIVDARVDNLEWTHVRRVLSVSNNDARIWYLEAANENMWSTRELDRNISTQYCERCLAAGQKPMIVSAKPDRTGSALMHLKSPPVAEMMSALRAGEESAELR